MEKAHGKAKSGRGAPRGMVAYIAAEKASMPLNAFYPKGQRVAVKTVVYRSSPSATWGKGIWMAGRNFDAPIRGGTCWLSMSSTMSQSENSLLSQR